MSDFQFVKPKRWEGKSLGFKLRFLAANYPEFGLASLVTFVVAPLIALYRIHNFPGSRNDALTKYKVRYTVIRDDHPDLEKVMAEKEMGREHFPKF